MSYIRCFSNPEGLYIWCDVRGKVHISYGNTPFMSEGDFTIPRHIFDHVCRRVKDITLLEDHISYRGLKVEEVLMEDMDEGVHYQIKLSYKDNYIYMYPTTWYYIINHLDF